MHVSVSEAKGRLTLYIGADFAKTGLASAAP